MKETRTINLNGSVFHIDYDAYLLLRDYLQDIEMRLPIDDRKDVLENVETRIAELFSNTLFANNTQVVTLAMVESAQSQIGAPAEFGPNSRPKTKPVKSHNSGCRRTFGIVLNIILLVLALPVIFTGLAVLFAIVMSLFGVVLAGGTTAAALMPLFPVLAEMFVTGGAWIIPLLMIALVLIIVLPIVMVVYTIVTYLRTHRGPKARFWWITVVLWLASLIFWGASLVHLYNSYEMAPDILKVMTLDGLDVDDAGTVTSQLQLDAYHSVELRGAAKLTLHNAPEASTMLTTNLLLQNIGVANIRAEVRDSVLYIETPTTPPIDDMIATFTIASPILRQITVYGAGEIESAEGQVLAQPELTLNLNGAAEADLLLNVQSLTIDAKGASKLDLQGTADKANITIAGAGELEAEDLLTQVMHINCAGASHAEVNVATELWAQAAGASKITYKGTPRIKQNMAVGGSTIRRD